MNGRNIFFAVGGAWLLMVVGGLPAATARGEAADYVVALRELPTDRTRYADHPVVAQNDAIRFLVLRGSPESLEHRLREDSNVIAFERDDEIYHTLLTPNDGLYGGYQYDLKPGTTDIEAAWNNETGASAVKVCVADTGQFRGHQDFQGAAWADWKDFVRGKTSAYDDNGHGTHVTGTIGAVMNNGKGVAGIAQVSLAGAKVLSRTGSGTISAVANGITWCADIGAHVINLSLGGGYSSTIEAAVDYAHAKGALVVAAAGNSGPCSDCVGYPAALPNAFAVACTDQNNAQCSFSSEGPEVDVAAPGKDIASTYPPLGSCGRKNTNCYVLMSGTSMSTPHVAGLAALVKSEFPEMASADLRGKLTGTALDLGASGPDAEFGAGLIRGAAVL